MQVYDILMLIVIAGAVLFGLWKGLAWQIASIAAIALSYFVTFELRSSVADALPVAPPWNQLVAVVALFLGTSLAVWIGFRFVKDFINRVKLKEFDRHTGAVVGGIKGIGLCLIITLFAMSSLGSEQKQMVCQSYSGYCMALLIEKVQTTVPEEVLGHVVPYIEKLDEELKCARDPDHRHDEPAPPPAAVDPYAPTAVDPGEGYSPPGFSPDSSTNSSPPASSGNSEDDLQRAARAARAAAEEWFRQ